MPYDTTLKIDHRFHNMYTDSWRYMQNFLQESERNYDYYDGDQWTAEELKELERRGQPATVLNMIRPTIDMLLAMEIQRQTETVINGREESDDDVARLLQALLKQVHDDSNHAFQMTRQFRNGATGGIGWIGADIVVDDYSGEKCVRTELLPWEEMYIDPFFRRMDGSDARWIIRQKWMDVDEAKKLWPAHEDAIAGYVKHSETAGPELEYTGQEREAQTHTSSFSYVVADQAIRRIAINEVYYTVPDPEGNGRHIMRHLIYTGDVFLKGDDKNDMSSENDPPLDIPMYPWVPFIASRDRKGRPQGMVKFLISAQEQLNKLNSKYIANLNTRQILIEADAAEDPDEFKQEAAKSDGMMVVMPNALKAGKVLIRDNFAENQQSLAKSQETVELIQRISGVNDATLGLGGTNARSAQQEQGRMLQGAAMQSDILQNFFFTKSRIDRVVLMLIGKHYTKKMAVRVVGPSGDVTFEYINDETPDGLAVNDITDVLRFDVVTKQEAYHDSVRSYQTKLLMDTIAQGGLPPPIASRLIVQTSSLPNKEEILQDLDAYWKAALGGQQQGPQG